MVGLRPLEAPILVRIQVRQPVANPPAQYSLYILRCKDGTLYTGITTDLTRRLAEHKAGKGGAYTRARGADRFVYTETIGTRSDASKREAAVKALPRREKLRLCAKRGTHTP